ncbi:MAG: L-serine ammonia-lyase, iron-sulfur-dependent, subunit alpha [Syntrophomonadaceae bacterium]|jgi:L-serine dehydratase|nr:L-serine ammonia-lyase, iron-sulfur-dependent, subunit alpha [Syntrophomonadaceae bacterium]
MYQYSSGEKLLQLCHDQGKDIAEIAIIAEVENSGNQKEQIIDWLKDQIQVMGDSIKKGLAQDIKSIGGLIGGNACKLQKRLESGDTFCGAVMLKSISYALAVTEVNAAMGRVVAAPTAGASGIIPGVLIALQEEKAYTDEEILHAFIVSGAIGKIIATNATLSGAEGGCQAECGSASAMAAAAAVYLNGGGPEQCLDAAAMALKGLLGLVCDPVAGLVEVPCSKRNASSVANALACAEMALAGITSFIPFDEVVEAMFKVGNMMSPALRETAGGGCADTATARNYSRMLHERRD